MKLVHKLIAPVLAVSVIGLAACGSASHPDNPDADLSQFARSAQATVTQPLSPPPMPSSSPSINPSYPTTVPGPYGDASSSDSSGLVPITKVKFVISGYAPGDPECGGGCGPDISYGSDTDTHDVQPDSINGTVTYTVPFDPSASYYSVNVSTSTSSSHLTCKIVAVGPSPDAPTTVAKGSETGQAECSAQAAPSDETGESWTEES